MTPRDQAARGPSGQADQRDRPASGLTLEVVAGHPSADELAALTVALAAALAAGDRRPGPGGAGGISSGWADRSAMLGAPLTPGRDAWRRSARPGRAGRAG
jgi:acyl-CoA carboxylase epsilon subunit